MIVGIRSLDEINYFKKYIKNIKIVALVSSQETRFRRLNVRGRSDDPKNILEFIKYREENETKIGIEDAIKNSDYFIENSGSLEELEKSIFFLLEEISSI